MMNNDKSFRSNCFWDPSFNLCSAHASMAMCIDHSGTSSCFLLDSCSAVRSGPVLPLPASLPHSPSSSRIPTSAFPALRSHVRSACPLSQLHALWVCTAGVHQHGPRTCGKSGVHLVRVSGATRRLRPNHTLPFSCFRMHPGTYPDRRPCHFFPSYFARTGDHSKRESIRRQLGEKADWSINECVANEKECEFLHHPGTFNLMTSFFCGHDPVCQRVRKEKNAHSVRCRDAVVYPSHSKFIASPPRYLTISPCSSSLPFRTEPEGSLE